jgi:Rod binding domain-containing protein
MTALAPPTSLLAPVAAPQAAHDATAAKIRQTAEAFEASFISALLQPVFDSLSTAPPFGGGQGEDAFKSFMVDAIAKQTVKAGGIGLASSVQREMLKMQGLDAPAAPTGGRD